MRMSREVTAASKARIVAAAAKMLRQRGVAATSVADVMHAAGMTHGGILQALPIQGCADGGRRPRSV